MEISAAPHPVPDDSASAMFLGGRFAIDKIGSLVEGGNAYGKFINAAAAPSKIYGYIVPLIFYTGDGSMYGEGGVHGDTCKYPSDKVGHKDA